MQQVKIRKRKYTIRKARITRNHYGDCDRDLKEIRLAHDLKSYIQAKTLFHEITHGIFEEYLKDVVSDETEEQITKGIERGFTEFAKNNPEAWIMLAIRLARIK